MDGFWATIKVKYESTYIRVRVAWVCWWANGAAFWFASLHIFWFFFICFRFILLVANSQNQNVSIARKSLRNPIKWIEYRLICIIQLKSLLETWVEIRWNRRELAKNKTNRTRVKYLNCGIHPYAVFLSVWFFFLTSFLLNKQVNRFEDIVS